MYHRVKQVYALPQAQLNVIFSNGTTKVYDVKPLIDGFEAFSALQDEKLFYDAMVDVGGCGVSWNDDIDISCNELWANGIEQKTPFDGLISFKDACDLWGLNESTLRKAVFYGKIVAGIDARNYGKQWVITKEAMFREYGEPLPE